MEFQWYQQRPLCLSKDKMREFSPPTTEGKKKKKKKKGHFKSKT
jgi:hypothetical protein